MRLERFQCCLYSLFFDFNVVVTPGSDRNKLPIEGERLTFIIMKSKSSFQYHVALSAELDEAFVRELDPDAKFKTDHWPGRHWKVRE